MIAAKTTDFQLWEASGITIFVDGSRNGLAQSGAPTKWQNAV